MMIGGYMVATAKRENRRYLSNIEDGGIYYADKDNTALIFDNWERAQAYAETCNMLSGEKHAVMYISSELLWKE